MSEEIKTVLSIAGFDPSAGAGMLADMRVFNALGLYGTGVLTAVTVQNTQQVERVVPLAGEDIGEQLRKLIDDITPVATKTGMLVNVEAVDRIAGPAARGELGIMVIDPVLSSTSGSDLFTAGLVDAIREKLLPYCQLVTPNLLEAELLTGVKIVERDDAVQAARRLAESGVGCVCITGGHWPGEPVDILLEAREIQYLKGTRRDFGTGVHGTGCLFSAAAAGYMALGSSPGEAVYKAKRYSEKAMIKSFRPGLGMWVPWVKQG